MPFCSFHFCTLYIFLLTYVIKCVCGSFYKLFDFLKSPFWDIIVFFTPSLHTCLPSHPFSFTFATKSSVRALLYTASLRVFFPGSLNGRSTRSLDTVKFQLSTKGAGGDETDTQGPRMYCGRQWQREPAINSLLPN